MFTCLWAHRPPPLLCAFVCSSPVTDASEETFGHQVKELVSFSQTFLFVGRNCRHTSPTVATLCCQEEKYKACVTCSFSFQPGDNYTFSLQWKGKEKKRERAVAHLSKKRCLCQRGTEGRWREQTASDAEWDSEREGEREINTDGESEAVEIPLTDVWVSPSPKCRSDDDARPATLTLASACLWVRSDSCKRQPRMRELPRVRRCLVESSTPTAWAKVRDMAPCFISADENVPICVFVVFFFFLSFANDGHIACSVQTRLGLKPDTHTTQNKIRKHSWGKKKKQSTVHIRDDCSCASFVAVPVDCICFTVAFSGRMAPWIIYATNEFSCRCRCSAEDNQGTSYRRRFHRARLVVEQKSNMWKWN